MFTDKEIEILQSASEEGKTFAEAAELLGLHRTTVERKLLKHHHLVPVYTYTFRLVTLEEHAALQRQKSEAPGSAETEPGAVSPGG